LTVIHAWFRTTLILPKDTITKIYPNNELHIHNNSVCMCLYVYIQNLLHPQSYWITSYKTTTKYTLPWFIIWIKCCCHSVCLAEILVTDPVFELHFTVFLRLNFFISLNHAVLLRYLSDATHTADIN